MKYILSTLTLFLCLVVAIRGFADETGILEVESEPSGAMVYLKGQPPKEAPRSFKKVDVGRYEVEFKLKGKTLLGHFDVIKNETVTLIADFDKGIIINKWEKEKAESLIKEEEERKEKARRAKFEKIVVFSDNLIWQKQNDGNCYDWYDADKYCKELKLAGVKNWRLPSINDFKSVANSANSFILSTSEVWTSNPVVLKNGQTVHDKHRFMVENNGQFRLCSRPTTKRLGVICVNSASIDDIYDDSAEVESKRLAEERKKVVRIKNLTLGPKYKRVKYSEAESYCNSLKFAGYEDWRLPTYKEAYTINKLSSRERKKFEDIYGCFDTWTSTPGDFGCELAIPECKSISCYKWVSGAGEGCRQNYRIYHVVCFR